MQPEPDTEHSENFDCQHIFFGYDEEGRLWALTSMGWVDCTPPQDKREIN